MEIGVGLLIGIITGAALGMILVVIGAAVRKGKKAPPASEPQTRNTTSVVNAKSTRISSPTAVRPSATAVVARPSRGETKMIEALGVREQQLGKSVFEVRNLVVKLGDIVNRTDSASGEAAEAFSSARDTLGLVNVNDTEAILSAHAVTLKEITRVMVTNDKLRSELTEAKKGIEDQRKQIEELKNAVRIDTLTQLPNRAAFNERLIESIYRRDRTGETFSLLMLDIDFFKRVNDTYGHLSGDRILKGVSLKIKENVRGNDFAARYGGEEFVVILPGTGLAEARMVADRMCADIGKTVFKLDGKDIKVTISGGLAEALPGLNAEEIIKAADTGLYDAKTSGRNGIKTIEPAL